MSTIVCSASRDLFPGGSLHAARLGAVTVADRS